MDPTGKSPKLGWGTNYIWFRLCSSVQGGNKPELQPQPLKAGLSLGPELQLCIFSHKHQPDPKTC